MRYAIQFKSGGAVLDYCETEEQAEFWLKNYPVELVDTTKSSKIVVTYTELGGPQGYGHQEECFATFGGLLPCVRNLVKWMQSTAGVFGPDARDIRDFFRHCSLYVNDANKTQWLISQAEKLDIHTLYV